MSMQMSTPSGALAGGYVQGTPCVNGPDRDAYEIHLWAQGTHSPAQGERRGCGGGP